MAVPKKRTASSKRRMRRSHHARRPRKLIACPRCKNLIISHVACPHCGTYQGRQVIDVLSTVNKKERKKKEKARTQEKSS